MMKRDTLALKIGIEGRDRETLSKILNGLLATSYALYLKTQNFHWNVTGPTFQSYHLMFQDQYEELAEAIDEMAERVRALGFFPDGSFSAFAKQSLLEETNQVLPPMRMIETLLQDHETVIRYLRENLPKAEKVEDGATADFINKRLAFHEKTAWMLRSTLTSL